MNRWGWLTCLVVVGCLLFGCSKEEKSDMGEELKEGVAPAAKQVQEAAEEAADVVEDTAEEVAE